MNSRESIGLSVGDIYVFCVDNFRVTTSVAQTDRRRRSAQREGSIRFRPLAD